MKQYLPAVIVIILILGFFGIIIYLDMQNSKQINARMGGQPAEESAENTRSGDSAGSADSSEKSNQSMNSASPAPAKSLPEPEMTIDQSKSYTATIHTDKGDIVVDLHADQTPITVNNFVYLARQKFYDTTIFHRVIKDFMIQGGDPTGTGAGGPGYRFDDEPFSGAYVRGTVAMANAGPDTNGSQFFIMHGEQALPPNYVIFGNVVDGLDVLDAIATSDVVMSEAGEPSKPVKPVTVQSVDITEQ